MVFVGDKEDEFEGWVIITELFLQLLNPITRLPDKHINIMSRLLIILINNLSLRITPVFML
jgi:hypothetical protein